MKKSIGKRITVMGIIGVITLAGAGSVFAAENGFGEETAAAHRSENEEGEETRVTYMNEYEAMAVISGAKASGEFWFTDNKNNIVVKQGGVFYTYHFEVTAEKEESSWFDTESEAYTYAQIHYVRDLKISSQNDSEGPMKHTAYCAKGIVTYGNLSVTCTRLVQSHAAEMAVMCGTDDIVAEYC